MEKIWLKNYPEGIPAEINPDTYQSITEIFEMSCREFSELAAFSNMGVKLTYGQLDKLTRDFAAYLQQELHLQKGDRIGIMLPNILQYPVALFGAFRAGLAVVNINPLYTSDELIHQLNDSGTETIIVLENFAATVEKSLPKVPKLKNIIITKIGDLFPRIKAMLIHLVLKYIRKAIPAWKIPQALSFHQALFLGKDKRLSPITIANQDIAFLQYTGGTTGVSKGAILTHRNIVANIMQADAWFSTLLRKEHEIIITALPLYHIFSLTANCLYFTKIGGLNVLITNPRDIANMVKEMGRFKFTAMTGVNTLFKGMLHEPSFAKLDFSELRITLGGGMAVQQVVAEKWHKVTNCVLLEAYGLTETSPCVVINPVSLKEYNGSIGLPVPSTDVRFLDDQQKEVPIGQAGELAVKGPQVTQGYWQNPVETAKVFTEDGWLLTGDIASINQDGYITLLERKKDMILVSGFNVYPNEIEGVIAKMPGVHEVAIVGVYDENSGETVKAFVVKSDKNLSEKDVIKFARERLTPYKVPKYVEFRDQLPKTNVGKILRRALRDPAKS